MSRGPYVDEAGPGIYFPASDYAFNEARHEAAEHAREMNDGWTRTRYTGKRDLTLHDHDEPWGPDDCPPEPVWTFETYEGTWRR